jgi:competence protein ComEC
MFNILKNEEKSMTIIFIMIAYIIGIIWGLYIKNIAPLFLIIILLIAILKFTKFKRIFKKLIPNKKLILMLIVFFLSVIQILILEKSFENKYKNITGEIQVEAIVVSNANKKEYKDVYTIKIISINGDKKYKGTRLKLSIKNNKNNIEYGDKIIFTGEYEEPETQRNYGGFNYKEYLKTKKIYGLISTNKIEKIEKKSYNKILILINKFSNKITQNANEILEEDEANLLTGILIGNKENLSTEIQESFRNSNLSHMLAVSGAHVSYIILGITVLLNKSKINKKISKIITIIALILFIILTGATASVTRACIMAIYVIVASLLYKKPNTFIGISISILIILLINPYNLLDVGLQLSYGGTLGIILFNKIFEGKIKLPNIKILLISKILNSLKQMLIVSISANLIIFPIIAFHYNTVSLTFFISNILAGPILGIIIILGFITIFISFVSIKISKVFSFILSMFLKLLILIANFSSNLPLSKIYVKTPSIFLIIIYYLILLIFLYSIKRKKLHRFERILIKKVKSRKFKKSVIAIILVVVIVFQLVKIIPSNLKIYFIDVGQGDSTLIVTPKNKTILIDGGGSSSDNYDVGKNTLLPYLLDRGITKVDYMFISHFDMDHCGGLLYILENLKVKNVIIGKQFDNSENYKTFLNIIKSKKIKVNMVEEGVKINIEKNLYFDVIWPSNKQAVTNNSINNNALVFKLNYKNFTMLFTGDIEEETEKILVSKYLGTNALKASVLKVGHHGSKTSSTQEFLELVKPQIALIGVGKNNKFGHPNEDVLERLKNLNCKIYRTDEMGEVILKIKNNR